MQRSWLTWLWGLAYLAVSLFCFRSFFATVAAVPEPMLLVSGTVASAAVETHRGRISVIRFKVAPGGQAFAYRDTLKNKQLVSDKIQTGLPVEVQYINPENPQLWGLRVAGETLLSPVSASRARRQGGYFVFATGCLFLLIGLYMIARARQSAD